MKSRLKVNGALIVCAVVLILIFPKVFLQWRSLSLSGWIIRTCGVILVLLGQLLRVSARGYKSENSGNGRLLIQGGPYRLVRNPMYLGILLIGLGLGLLLFKYWVTLVFLGIFFIRYVKLIFAEEKKLLKVFGNAYIDYCRQVPWLLPSLKSLFRRDVRFYLPVKPAWIYKEIGAIIATLVMLLLFWLWEGWRQ